MRQHVMASTLVTLALCARALAAPAPDGQQPRLVNGRLDPRTAGQSLDRTFRGLVDSATEPAWIGYAVPVVPGDHTMCCHGDGWMTACGLEPQERRTRVDAQSQASVSGPVRLEGPESML